MSKWITHPLMVGSGTEETAMPFTVDAVQHLPAGFGETFAGHTAEVNGVELHAVVGGTGPALLLPPSSTP